MPLSPSPVDEEAPVPDPGGQRRRHWLRNRQLIGALLVVWFAVTFVVSYFARSLNFSFFGWPFSFWVGAQGALVVYALIIGVYAWRMDRLDAEHGVDEPRD